MSVRGLVNEAPSSTATWAGPGRGAFRDGVSSRCGVRALGSVEQLLRGLNREGLQRSNVAQTLDGAFEPFSGLLSNPGQAGNR